MTAKGSLTLNGMVVEARLEDGYINATQLCKAGGKRFNNWNQLENTKVLIKELSVETGVPSSSLLDSKVGGNHSGSWIHPYLAVQLAQWISPKFSIKVSKWISDWRSYSRENESEFIDALNSLEPSRNTKREKELQDRLRIELNAEIEVHTPVGRIDLLTRDTVIEIKEYSAWKHAVGQISCYGLYYKDKQKKIILFGSGNIDELIKKTCSELDIEVEILE